MLQTELVCECVNNDFVFIFNCYSCQALNYFPFIYVFSCLFLDSAFLVTDNLTKCIANAVAEPLAVVFNVLLLNHPTSYCSSESCCIGFTFIYLLLPLMQLYSVLFEPLKGFKVKS